MADDTNEDSWLYGTSNAEARSENEKADLLEEHACLLSKEAPDEQDEEDVEHNNNVEENFEGKQDVVAEDYGVEQYDYFEEDNEAAVVEEPDCAVEHSEEQEELTSKENLGSEEEDDDSDDDINVVIGDIKAAPSTYNIKQRTNLLAGTAGQDKSKAISQGGKFSMDEFEGVGNINGVPAHEFSIDSLEEKPWRKPGADITDYFNYGFNEETWRAYCERQKRYRVTESGVGLASLTQNMNQSSDRYGNSESNGLPPQQAIISTPQNVSIPSLTSFSEQMQMPPPNLITPGMPMLHVHGPRMGLLPRGPRLIGPPTNKENAIQVMTAECREYSRPGSTQIPPNFPPGPNEEPFFPEADPYDYGYEPTQESQWNNDNSNWIPTGIKELTPGPLNVPPPQMGVPTQAQIGVPPPQMGGPPPQMRPHPQMMPGMPPPNMNMGPMPNMGPIMMGPGNGPPMRMPLGPPPMMGPMGPVGHPDIGGHMLGIRERSDRRERERDRDRRDERDREPDHERDRDRERDRSRDFDRERSTRRDRDRDYDRERTERRERERERDTERDRSDRDKGDKIENESERGDEERERRRRDRERERERERERDRERSRRERSKSRDKPRRRSKSREKERERSSKNSSTSTSITHTSSSSRSDKKKSSSTSTSQRKEDDE